MNRVVQSEIKGHWLRLMLNRPSALNAVNTKVSQYGVYDLVTNVLKDNVKGVIGCGAGRAVAAGGDIRFMLNHISKDEMVTIEEYLRVEYQFYYLMHTLPIPSVLLMPQITMGGGLGFSAGATCRIATDRSRLAMPEVKIGFFADVASSSWFQKLHPGSGKWMGLTGQVLGGEEAMQIGLVTHFVDFEKFDQLVADIQNSQFSEVENIISHYARPVAEMSADRAAIYRAFDEESVDSILSNLAEIDSEESRRTLSLLDEVCPISVILSNEIFNAGAGLTLAECLKNEFRMGRVQFRDYNFIEGVTALLLDKGRKPIWKPAVLSDVIKDGWLDSIEEHVRRCRLPCPQQDGFIHDGAPPTSDAVMIDWAQIKRDPTVIEHFFPAEYR